mmetsp:Transcript_96892/g.273884  ORF Transcript_96892/g.273884 Transcript_96892/m.273884 type:complete len:215 (-) Transcript_96892:29-673(-)
MANDDGCLPRLDWAELDIVRVAVVPLHKWRGPDHAAQILAWYAQVALPFRPGADDDGVVALPQDVEGEHARAAADRDVSEEAEARCARDAGEVVRDVLHLGVVRRDAEAHQTVWRREAFIHVDFHMIRPRLLEEVLRRVKSSRTAADDGDVMRLTASGAASCSKALENRASLERKIMPRALRQMTRTCRSEPQPQICGKAKRQRHRAAGGARNN